MSSGGGHLKKVISYLSKHGNVALPSATTPTPSALFSALSSTSATLIDNYSSLVERIEERKYLHSLDTGAENKLGHKELTRRSAARSGFQMPKEYSPNDDN
mgnify:CR=1